MKDIKKLIEFSIINLDKPSGPTSFSVSDYVRRIFGIKKTSHFGTLDPKVTGVLPIALNRACKLTGFLLGHDKEYVGIMHVHQEISQDELEKIIKNKFLGKIKQTPPKKSRVKRQEREREIKSFEILEKNGKDFLFKTKVQGGTYIRKLIDDIGKEIQGAHMLELRRTQAGVFNEKESITLYTLDNAVKSWKTGKQEDLKKILIPAEEIIKKVFPVVQASSKNLKKLLTGKPLMKNDLVEKLPDEETFAVFFKERFIEIAKKTDEREIIARPLFVLN